jgi:hypothetical protein
VTVSDVLTAMAPFVPILWVLLVSSVSLKMMDWVLSAFTGRLHDDV